MDVKIKLELKGMEFELDEEEVQRLYDKLHSLFGKRTQIIREYPPYIEPYYPLRPVITYCTTQT